MNWIEIVDVDRSVFSNQINSNLRVGSRRRRLIAGWIDIDTHLTRCLQESSLNRWWRFGVKISFYGLNVQGDRRRFQRLIGFGKCRFSYFGIRSRLSSLIRLLRFEIFIQFEYKVDGNLFTLDFLVLFPLDADRFEFSVQLNDFGIVDSSVGSFDLDQRSDLNQSKDRIHSDSRRMRRKRNCLQSTFGLGQVHQSRWKLVSFIRWNKVRRNDALPKKTNSTKPMWKLIRKMTTSGVVVVTTLINSDCRTPDKHRMEKKEGKNRSKRSFKTRGAIYSREKWKSRQDTNDDECPSCCACSNHIRLMFSMRTWKKKNNEKELNRKKNKFRFSS